MVKVTAEPIQLAIGVTVIVLIMGVGPGLVAVNVPIFPEPLAANPIFGVIDQP